jgi:putative phosphoesterase
MRIALISDLHGNLVALRAVLERLKAEPVDRLICLGDCATLGPDPAPVLDVLAENDCPCILGNHDEFLLDPDLIHRYTELPSIVSAVAACRASLSSAHLAFVANFRRSLDLDLDGATLSAFHGSPRSNMENLLAATPERELDEAIGASPATVMVGGHTHIQMLRQHRGTLLVNPGSLGMPFESFVSGRPPRVLAHAEFAVVESKHGAVSVALQRLPIDKSELIDSLKTWDNPLRDWLLGQYAA